jgi:hypothetical protein
MSINNSDQQKLFESYLKINEDLGLGPKRKGTKEMEVTSIGSTGGVGRSHMDISRSTLTPTAENEEMPKKKHTQHDIDTIIDNIIDNLNYIRTKTPVVRSLDRKLLLKSVQHEVDRIVNIVSKGEVD